MTPNTLTIIVPVYNVEKYIYDAINSIINQSVPPDRVIIINDGTTDKSISIIKELIEPHKYIELVNKENGGLSSARNMGLSLTTTEYLYFFDSDDILEFDFVSDFKSHVLDTNFDIFFFSGNSFTSDKNIDISGIPSYKRENLAKLDSHTYFENALKSNNYYSSVCLCIFKTSIIKANNIVFPPIIHEDEAFLPYVIFHSNLITSTSKVYFNRRIRANSIMTSQKNINNVSGYLYTLNVYSNLIKKTTKTKLNKQLKIKHDQFGLYILKICISTQIVSKESQKIKFYLIKNKFKAFILRNFKNLYLYYSKH